MPMMSLTELARPEGEFCWSRLECRRDTNWSAVCRDTGSSRPADTRLLDRSLLGLGEGSFAFFHLESYLNI